MARIKLNLINRSTDADNQKVVLFQKNKAADAKDYAVAWRVIRDLGREANHPFTYSLGITVCAEDSGGNYTPQLKALPGKKFSVMQAPTGSTLIPNGKSETPHEIEISNSLSEGAISGVIFRDGLLLAAEPQVAPEEKAVFQLPPTLSIAVAPNVEEGQSMDKKAIPKDYTELPLQGISSADIIMTGGGDVPVEFRLENIEWA